MNILEKTLNLKINIFFLYLKKKKKSEILEKILYLLKIMYSFFIVIRKTTEFNPELITYGQLLATAEKLEENPHIHIIIETQYTEDALRYKLKKLYPIKGQISMSKLQDKYKASKYIMKEFNIITNNLFKEKELEELIEDVKETQIELTECKKNYMRYLIHRYKEDNELITNNDYDWIEFNIQKWLFQVIRGDYKGFDKVMMTRWRNGIINYYYPQTFTENRLLYYLPNNTYAENYKK